MKHDMWGWAVDAHQAAITWWREWRLNYYRRELVVIEMEVGRIFLMSYLHGAERYAMEAIARLKEKSHIERKIAKLERRLGA